MILLYVLDMGGFGFVGFVIWMCFLCRLFLDLLFCFSGLGLFGFGWVWVDGCLGGWGWLVFWLVGWVLFV